MTEYYFIDLPKFIERKNKREAQKLLEKITTIVMTNNRSIAEESEYAKYLKQTQARAGIEEQEEKFDKRNFDRLRHFLKT